jgi:photosystem II stability/assembly factor-like uncharacterized protein
VKRPSLYLQSRRCIALSGVAAALSLSGVDCIPKAPEKAATSTTPHRATDSSAISPPTPLLPLPASPKVDDIVARNIAARGGIEKLRAIRSLRITGILRLGGDTSRIEASYGELLKRAGKARSEISFQGLTGVDSIDGRTAWSTSPWQGRRDPFLTPEDDAKARARAADIDGPLVDWREKGHRVEYLGTEEIDGTQAHKLRVALKDGDTEYRYLDPDAFLEIRVVTESHVRGIEEIRETDFGDYEQVAGVYMPFSIESGDKGVPRSARVTVERVEVNVDIDDSAFAFPAPDAKILRSIFPKKDSPPNATEKKLPNTAGTPTFDSGVLSGLGARNIGSAAMSGRVSALAAHNENGKTTVYVGAASGGIWKSLDGGTTFTPIFDKQPVQSIGAIAIDPSNTKTLWVGTGESWTRNSVSIGDGIYKSTDAGATWTNVGLKDSERITRILVNPKNSDIVYACVPGKLWSDSPARGLYKTIDGGKTWSLVLKGQNLSTGCSGLSLDPKNPDIVFAGLWDFRRKGWTYRSGGEGPDTPSGSAMFRSTDGGGKWTALTSASNKGLPPAPWGRVEVAVAPSDGSRVYALIESKDSALFASEDGGATWEKRDKSQAMVWRPFYFARLVVDPLAAGRLFKPDLNLIVSEDGGKSFAACGGGAHGDWHDVWIDPANTKHVIGGDDGGLWTSWDGGNRWWKSNNLPISQFYHVSVDAKDPYQVYGGLQDNSSWVGDSAYPGGITNSRWENLYGGDGFYTLVDPTDDNAVYAESQGGAIGRIDRRTHTARNIQPVAGFKEKLRFNWNAPIHASPSQKGTIYIGAQLIFRSRDRGDSWERISPDLTTNDKEKQKQEESGGVTVDNSSAEMHTTVYAISESPRDAKVLWAGTDDGNLQLTRDSGKTWKNVVGNVTGLPKASWVSWVEASRFDAGTAYAAFDRHTFGDMTPWVYKTTDFGATWARIVAPEQGVRGYAHVIKEDIEKPKILFVGTEFGLWISVDGGDKWAEFKGGDFPSVAVRDLQVHPRTGDLVVATHGRGIYIVDDLSPLRALTTDLLARPASVLQGHSVQQRMAASGGWPEGDAAFAAENPSNGAVITYYQRARHLFGRLKLEVLDAKGAVLDTLTATKRRGLNRVVWSMRTKPPVVPRAAQVAYSATQGPRVLPGTYTVRLTKGDEAFESKIDVGLDRRATFTISDRKVQFDAAMRAHALFGEMSSLSSRIDTMRSGVDARLKSLANADGLAPKLLALNGKLDTAKRRIVATKEGGAITGEERIREHLNEIYGTLLQWEGKPGRYQIERIDSLKRELDEVSTEVDGIVKNDVAAVDAELRAKKLETIPQTASPEAARDIDTGDSLAAAERRCVSSRGRECNALQQAAGQARD